MLKALKEIKDSYTQAKHGDADISAGKSGTARRHYRLYTLLLNVPILRV